MNRIVMVLMMSLGINSLYSQLVVESLNTVEDYVQNVLLGEGVNASNITFNGMPANEINLQCGFFNSVNSNVGIDSGLVMATGDIQLCVGPNNTGNFTLAPPVSVDGDDDLEEIAGIQVNDVAILEFDFIPSSDTLEFNYVFGSEEYLEWVGSINDVFGFFLSGPDITGPYSSPPQFNGSENIALIPGTTDPVSIFSVNDTSNPDFYVNNEINTGGTEVQFDGLTVVLTAVAAVTCGELHHIKLAIADASDDILDSGVFLEAGSFQSIPDELVLDSFFELGIVETSGNCDTSFSNFSRQCAADSIYFILKFQGDAEQEIDYQIFNVPDTILMVPQVFAHNFGILALADGIQEGDEEIEVILCSSSDAAGPFLPQDTATINIIDEFILPIETQDINLICPIDEVIILAEATQGVPVFEYTWENSSGDEIGEGPILTVPVPSTSAQYTVSVIDFCGFTGDATVTVTNNIPPDPSVSISDNGEPFCPGAGFPLQGNIQDGTPGFTYFWLPTGSMADTTTITPPLGSLGPYPVSLVVTDFCNRVAEISMEYIPPLPPDAQLGLNDFLCLGDPLSLQTTIADGTGTPPYNFLYLDVTNGGILNPDFYSSSSGIGEIPNLPLGTQEIQVIVTDFCQQFDPIYTGFDSDTLETITCFIPNVITPNGDNQNDAFIVFEMLSRDGTLHIYNRWGAEILETRENSWDGEDYPGGTYFYAVEFDDGSESKSGSFTLLK
ncbi:MAG: choice-of-anchor L domain-containing protein [Bacteroidota bacterium]